VFFMINFKLKHNNAMGTLQQNRNGNSAEIEVKLKKMRKCVRLHKLMITKRKDNSYQT
jgi:hypothetical protein